MILIREDKSYLDDGVTTILALTVDLESAKKWVEYNRPNAKWKDFASEWEMPDGALITLEALPVIDYTTQRLYVVMVCCTMSYEVEVMATSEEEAKESVRDRNLPELVAHFDQSNVEWFVQSAQLKEESE